MIELLQWAAGIIAALIIAGVVALVRQGNQIAVLRSEVAALNKRADGHDETKEMLHSLRIMVERLDARIQTALERLIPGPNPSKGI